jgi:hypothetical protein
MSFERTSQSPSRGAAWCPPLVDLNGFTIQVPDRICDQPFGETNSRVHGRIGPART